MPTQPDIASAPQPADSSSSSSAPQQTEPGTTEAQSGTVKEEQKAAEAASGDDREAAVGPDTDPLVDQPQGIHKDFRDAMSDLLMWVPAKDPQIATLFASYEASQHRHASAIK